jgi:hypothetical protein
MNISLGIMQGRLTPPEPGIQDEFYVGNNWKSEFEKIKKLENITLFDSSYKINQISHIEWVVTKNSFKNNPIFKNSLKKYPIFAISAYNMMDKSFYKKEFMEENLKPILEAAKKNGIKNVNIPLKEFSNIQNVEIRKEFIKNIKEYGKKYKSINFLFEFECWPEEILEVLRGNKNFKLTYNTEVITSFKGKQSHKYFFSKLHKHIMNVHLKDKGVKGKLLELGEGEVDFNEIVSNLMFVYMYKGNFTLLTTKGESKREMVTVAKHMKYFINIFANLKKLYGASKNKRQTVLV